MDIHGANSGIDRSRKAFEDRQRAVIDANRAIVRAARENLGAQHVAEPKEQGDVRNDGSRRDAVELSAAAQAASQPSPAEREARVRELAEAHRMERLHTPERLERAAQRLLEGS
jgi:hypothetical protein